MYTYLYIYIERERDIEADECEFVVQCRYEERLAEGFYQSKLWFEIEESPTNLFYITKDPVTWENFDADGTYGDSNFAPRIGTDDLIRVEYIAEARNSMRFPRKVLFDVGYYQVTSAQKVIVTAEMQVSDYDSDESNDEYELLLSTAPLDWQALMNRFQLPQHVYAMLFCVIGSRRG